MFKYHITHIQTQMYIHPQTHTVPAMPFPESHLPPLSPESPPVESFEKLKVGVLRSVISSPHPQPHHSPDKLWSFCYILRDFPASQVPRRGCTMGKSWLGGSGGGFILL